MTEPRQPGRPPLRFALVGCGVIGRQHAEALRQLGDRAELAVAVDTVPDAARRLADGFGVEAGTDVAAALRRPDIDAIAICTPSGTHADLAVAAMQAGKHVVVEKPVDVTVAAAQRVLAAQRSTGRKATVISQHRFDASSRLVRDAVVDGRLGRLTSGVASVAWWRTQAYYDSGEWRGTRRWDGGGAVMNQSIHTVDLLVWMLGVPVEVFAVTAQLAHERIEVEDTCVATIRFAGGALGVVHATTAAFPGLTARLQIHGSHGSAVIDDDRLVYFSAAAANSDGPQYGAQGGDNQAPALLAAPPDGSAPAGSAPAGSAPAGSAPAGSGAPAATAGSDPAALSDAHTAQYSDFVDAINEDRHPFVTVEHATTTLAVVTAMYTSAASGRPVRLST